MGAEMATIIQAIYCTLFGIIFLNFVESEFSASLSNQTYYVSQRKLSGRLKRSLYQEIPKDLQVRIELSTGRYTNLRWLATYQYLANAHLPVTTPNADINANVMRDVDEFVMYHDEQRCSAVVYFKKSKSLFGVIGTDHYIKNLKLEFDEAGHYRLGTVAEPFVQKREHPPSHIHPANFFPPPSDTDAWEDFLGQPHYDTDQNRKRKISCDAGPSTKIQHTDQRLGGRHDGEADKGRNSNRNTKRPARRSDVKQYYLEILVFVTRDIAELFKEHFGSDSYIRWIVRYYIIYFNSVDMLMKKFPSRPEMLQLNIAKIVIENDMQPFEFMSDDELQFSNIVEKLPQYLHAHQSEYIPDSFDYVFIHTSRMIMDDIIPINGLSKAGKDLYEARKHNQFYNAVPITVVRYRSSFADYIISAHEIGRTFNIKVDSRTNDLTSIGQCCGIMQTDGPKCINCLKWSDNSDKQFDAFFSTNRNRCFLLNEPRSLRPPGPSSFVTPHRQCLCFGYESFRKGADQKSSRKVLVHQCARSLECEISDGTQTNLVSTVRPFDGTPCANHKVCWNGECSDYKAQPQPRPHGRHCGNIS